MTVSTQDFNRNKHEYLTPTADRRVDQKLVAIVSDWVIPRLPPGGRVLELGVGDQIWTSKLVECFPDVVSIDGSKDLLEATAAKLKGKGWRGVVSRFEDYQPDALFDTILVTYVLEHVEDPGAILRRVRDWLRPGGHVAVVVPHALSLHRRLAVKLGMQRYPAELGDTDRRMDHKHVFTCYDMERLILDAEFDILEQRGLFIKVLPNSMLTSCSDAQLEAMVTLGLDLPIEYSAIIYFLAVKL